MLTSASYEMTQRRSWTAIGWMASQQRPGGPPALGQQTRLARKRARRSLPQNSDVLNVNSEFGHPEHQNFIGPVWRQKRRQLTGLGSRQGHLRLNSQVAVEAHLISNQSSLVLAITQQRLTAYIRVDAKAPKLTEAKSSEKTLRKKQAPIPFLRSGKGQGSPRLRDEADPAESTRPGPGGRGLQLRSLGSVWAFHPPGATLLVSHLIPERALQLRGDF